MATDLDESEGQQVPTSDQEQSSTPGEGHDGDHRDEIDAGTGHDLSGRPAMPTPDDADDHVVDPGPETTFVDRHDPNGTPHTAPFPGQGVMSRLTDGLVAPFHHHRHRVVVVVSIVVLAVLFYVAFGQLNLGGTTPG